MAKPSTLETSNVEARRRLVTRLRRLCQSDPASYLNKLSTTKPEVKDIWPDFYERVESEKLKPVPEWQPVKMSK